MKILPYYQPIPKLYENRGRKIVIFSSKAVICFEIFFQVLIAYGDRDTSTGNSDCILCTNKLTKNCINDQRSDIILHKGDAIRNTIKSKAHAYKSMVIFKPLIQIKHDHQSGDCLQ